MRKRNHKLKVIMTDTEIDHLNKLVVQSKLSREAYLRMLINGLVPRAAPSNELIEVILLLRGISNDIHQLSVDDPTYIKYNEDFHLLQDQITKIMFLIRQPTNLEELWKKQV